MTETSEEAKSEKVGTFWEHTEELVQRIKIVFYTVTVVTIFMIVFPANLSFVTNPEESYEPLVGALLRLIRTQLLPPGVQLIGVELASPVELYVVASILFGLMFSMPVAVHEIHQFVNPALYESERQTVYPFIISTAILTIIGALFGYFVVVPLALRGMLFFFPIAGAEPLISVMDFYMVVLALVMLTATTFTLPVFVVVLVRLGIMGTGFLRRNRKYVYAVLLLATMAISPGDPGLVGNAILFLPIVALMELGIYVAKRYETPEEKAFSPTFRCEYCGHESRTLVLFCPKCGKTKG